MVTARTAEEGEEEEEWEVEGGPTEYLLLGYFF